MKRTISMTTHGFLSGVLPILLVLIACFFAINHVVQSRLKQTIHASLLQSATLLESTKTLFGEEYGRLFAAFGENGSRKDGRVYFQGASLEPKDRPQLYKIIEAQLLRLSQAGNYSLLVLSDSNGNPIAGGIRKNGEFVPLDSFPGGSVGRAASCSTCHLPSVVDIRNVDESLFKLTNIVAAFGSDGLVYLTLGVRWDSRKPSNFLYQALVDKNQILFTTFSPLTVHDIQSQMQERCGGVLDQCEINVAGETLLSLDTRREPSGSTPTQFAFLSLDQAPSGYAGSIERIFLGIAAGGLLSLLLLYSFTSRIVTKPIRGLMAHLEESERTGKLRGDFRTDSPIKEANLLAAAFNRAAQAVDASDARNRALVDAIPDLMFRNRLDGTVLDFRARSDQYLELPRESIIGSNLRDRQISPDSADRILALFQRAIQTGQVQSIEYDLLTPDGTRHYDARISASGADELVTIVRDITDRKRAEEELRRQLRMKDAFFNESVSCFVLMDAQYNFIRVNEAYANACRRKVEDFPGRNHFDLYPSDAKEIFDEVVRTRKPFQTEARPFTFKDQPERGVTYWDWTLVPILDEKGEVEFLVFSLNDVTERKQAEDELRQKEAGFRLLFAANPLPTWVWDTESQYFLEVNDAAIAHYGFSREEFLGMRITDIHPPEDIPGFLERVRSPRPTVRRHFGARHILKDGRMIDVVTNTHTLVWKGRKGILVTVEDITDRKQSEEALRLSEERFRLLVEQAGDAFFMHDVLGKLLDVNQHACESVGYSRDELLHMNVTDIQQDIDLNTLIRNWNLLQPGQVVTLTGSHRRKDGTCFPVEVRVNRFDRYCERFYLALVRDITERKQAEERIRESNQKLVALVSSSPLAITSTDLNGNVQAWNPAAHRLFGWSEQEVLGRPVPIVPEDERPYFQEAMKQVSGGSALYGVERRPQRKDGSRLDVRFFLTPLYDTGGKFTGILAISEDITERKQTETALAESEERFRSLVQNATVGIYRTTPEGLVVMANPALVKMLGYSTLQELQSRNLQREGFSASYPRQLFCEQIEREGKVKGLESVWTRRDGSVVFVRESARVVRNANGDVLYYDGVVEDITERKRIEALHQLELTAIEQSADGIIITDTDGTIQYVNPAFTSITGYAQEEALGQNPRILKSGQHDRAFYQDLWESIKAGRVWGDELVNRKKDGSLYTQYMTVAPVRDKQGVITNFVVVQHDITESKLLQAQFLQAQKMEGIGQLAGGVAHDFNNLLNVVQGYSDLILERLDSNDPLRRFAEQIRKASERGASLTRQLLAFSRKQVLQTKVLDLNAVVAETEKLVRRLIGENINLVILPGAGLGRVKADPAQLDQVIMNLVINARDAMPQGGKLVIETANAELDETYVRMNPGAKQGSYIMLAVRDSGIGMDKATKARIFEPFFTTKGVGKGTGLGLSTVYGIVKQSGGYITVYSEPGLGTAFKIYLPRVQESLETVLAPQAAQTMQGSETILVAEDEPPLRALVREFMEKEGYHVLVARDGQEAIQIATQHTGPLHLLLTDVVMPEMTGLQLAQRLQSLHPETKILFMSGFPDALVADSPLESKTNLIEKPFTKQTLLRRLREVLEGRKLSI